MQTASRHALRKAMASYLVSIVIAIVLATFVFIKSESLSAAFTVGIGLALAGFRFFYLDYQRAKKNFIEKGGNV